LHWLNKVNLDDALTIRSTYKDNKFTDEDYIKMLESLKEKNPDLYKVWTLGEWGVKLELIYVPFEKLNEYPKEFDETIYGLDFGYNHPTVLQEINLKDAEYFFNQKLYESKLTNTKLIERLEKLIPNKNNPIYADCAEPARIEEISKAGFNIFPAIKSVKDGIDFLKSKKIYSNYENTETNEEVNVYSWKKDKNGDLLDEPVKFFDDGLDALRYGIYTHGQKTEPLISFY